MKDTERSGFLDEKELEVVLQDFQEHRRGHRHVSEEALAAQMAEMDTNGDGVVSWEEFIAFAEKVRKSSSSGREVDDSKLLLW